MLEVRRHIARGAIVTLALALAACASSPEKPVKTSGMEGENSQTEDSAASPTGSDSGSANQKDSEGDADSSPAVDLPVLEANKQLEEKRSMSARVKLVLTTEDGSTGGMSDKAWSFSEERRSGLESVDKSKATQLNVLFGKRNKSGLDSWTTLATEGKGYVIRSKAGDLQILDNGKKDAASGERDLVEAEYGFVGKSNPLLLLAYQSKSTGEAQPAKPEAYRWLIGHTPELEVEGVKIRYSGTEQHAGRDTAKLEVELTGKMKDGSTNYEYQLNGPGLLDVKTGYVVDLRLTGKVKVTGSMTLKGRKLSSSGDGEMTLTRTGKIN